VPLRVPTNSLNTTFATFWRALKKDRYLGASRPTCSCCRPIEVPDLTEEFKQELCRRDRITFSASSYWRAGWTARSQGAGTLMNNTIEHIIPQNPNPPWVAR